jgi:hypothetical protein
MTLEKSFTIAISSPDAGSGGSGKLSFSQRAGTGA